MKLPEALFFDQDGVIIDTEKDGHRVAFNKAFEEFGFDILWDVEEYGELIKISGGKERIKHFFLTKDTGEDIDLEKLDDVILSLHKRKTEIFVELIQTGSLALRPGIRRIMEEANEKGVPICICTTANQKAAEAVARHALSGVHFDHILAGDVVAKKKPAPDIYQLALEKTDTNPDNCIVVEDSRNGMLAGFQAGIKVVVTTSIYTEKEDFTEAAVVASCLGDERGEKGRLVKGDIENFSGVITLPMLGALL